jgi:DNA-binding CsgD family transcriptional regulator
VTTELPKAGISSEAPLLEGLIEAFCRQHALSPQEQRLVLAAVDERTLEDAAAELGCAPSTVRTYWVRICKKVGCSRTREVLARMLKFALVGSSPTGSDSP